MSAFPEASPLSVLSVAAQRWMNLPPPFIPAGVGVECGAVCSAAVLVGNDKDRVLKASDELGSNSNFLETFARCPADGCTTIMDIARQATGYEPMRRDAEGQARFRNYIDRLKASPFFFNALQDVSQFTRESKDWNDLVGTVVNALPDIPPESREEFRQSLINLVRNSFSHAGSQSSSDLFVQNVLSVSSQGQKLDYAACFYVCHVVVVTHPTKGGTTGQVHYGIERTRLQFDTERWKDLASQVWDQQVRRVRQWLEDNTTPSGNVRTRLCLR